MSINFFEAKCQSITRESLFGLCDDEDGSPAYLDYSNKAKWNAKVNNTVPPREMVFTAIDNCVEMFRENGEMENRCDGVLTYGDNIIFVELKNKGSNWISEGMRQLEVTIRVFDNSNGLSNYRHKRAFVANKKHPHFHKIDVEKKRKFWDDYRVRLNIDANIKIK